MAHSYRVGEVATLTGVSIRTLHHYDRLGLLVPSTRSDAGYRLYGAADLLRLQQILMLRFLGYRLKRIAHLLGRPDFDLIASLRIQRAALRDRIAEFERIETALGELVERRVATGAWNWTLVATASATVQGELERGGERMETYYTPEQWRRFAELGETVSADDLSGIEEGWTALLADVRASHNLDPTSAAARALVDRWDDLTALIARSYAEHPELLDAIRANYERGAFEGMERAPQAADFAIIERIKQTIATTNQG